MKLNETKAGGNGTMYFKPLTSEKTGTIFFMLSKAYKNIFAEYPGRREPWQRDWRAYDSDVCSHPVTVGERPRLSAR